MEGILNIDVRKVRDALRYFPERNVAIDVGSHVGATTVYMSKYFEHVNAFEAIPDTFELLEKNTDELDNVSAYNVAASDKQEEIYFEYLDDHSLLSHAISQPGMMHYGDEGSRVVGPVAAEPLDDMGFENVSFIKIDVEGSELDVLQGLKSTITASRPAVVIEQNQNESRYHGRKADEATEFLLDLGMTEVKEFRHPHDRLFTP